MRKKRGVIEFSWIFALIVGAVILFLAFYFIGTKFTEKKVLSSVETEQSLDIIFNPFSSFGGLGATSSKSIELKNSEKLNFSCNPDGLGFDSILVSTDAFAGPKKVYDKYIFSEKYIDGANYQIISKPFSMPWRVADFIYFIPKNKVYCFVGMDNVEQEFGKSGTGLNISNFEFDSCSADSITVCHSGCNITVGSTTVTKNGITVNYVDDATMYAAIFSDPEIYNCSMKRIGKRIEYQVDVYDGKVASILSRCNDVFNLGALGQSADYVSQNGESGLSNLQASAQTVHNQNMMAQCKLF